MGVVFDEVVAQVETPESVVEVADDETERGESPNAEARRWQRLQTTCARRQRRLEAD